MAELTLRDLCRWDRRLRLLCPPGLAEESALDRTLSWAVSVRATLPFLPPLRGDELIILSGRILREILATGTTDVDALLETLAEAPVAALITEPNLFEEPVGTLPFLLFPGPLPLDLESTLNRLLTEQRRALYRLSTELTRELSRAALTGGLEAVLQSAALASNRSLILQDEDGPVLTAAGPNPLPATQTAMRLARAHPAVRTLAEASGERLITTMSVATRTLYLSLVCRDGPGTERDRLVLSLTAGLCVSLLTQERRSASPASTTQLVNDLLLGRLTGSALAHAAQRLGLDLDAPVVVAIFGCDHPDELERRAHRLFDATTRNRSIPIDRELVFLLTTQESIQVEAQAAVLTGGRPTRSGFSISRETNPHWYLALSSPVAPLQAAREGLRQARFLTGLLRNGTLAGPIARFDNVDSIGPFSLLYALWGNPFAMSFRQAVLGPLLAAESRSHELLQTLAAFLELGSVSEVAIRLGIHRNTVAYRLAQVAERTGRNLSDARDRLLLHLALLLGALPPAEE